MTEAGDALDDAVRGGDVDDLLRLVDGLCADRDWSGLVTLRERCEQAQETGRQLWPAVAHAEYRLALEAPAEFAAAVLTEGAGRFALGPLPEVAAQAHTWEELAPVVPSGASAVVTAHERVVRGEDCSAREPDGPTVLDLPLRLSSWEPQYAVAEYRSDGADFPAPDLPKLVAVELPATPSGEPGLVDEGCRALLDLVQPWTDSSDGHARAVDVAGTALDAVAALDVGAVRAAELDAATACSLMAWAGASGGSHGRRPGAAAGRFGAWWAIATLAGLGDDWPPDPERIGAAARDDLRWLAWRADAPSSGWQLHLAVEHPTRGHAWAITARDTA